MRIPILVTMIMLLALLLVSISNHSVSATRATLNIAAAAAPPARRLNHFGGVPVPGAASFSSAYTNLTRCGSGLTKKEEKEAEAHGSDIPTRCKGYGGYEIYISYSACTSEISVEKGEERIHLATQAVGWKQKTVEWRLANGKPFAVIMRAYEYSGSDLCATDGKITGESLLVKGLKGYEQIDGAVNVKTTPAPNVKAREIADKGYR